MTPRRDLRPHESAVLGPPPRRFKVIEVAIDSIFDVWIYVWDPAANAWRPLTPGEQRTLWEFRGR